MVLVIERAMALTGATGAVIELVDGDAMLYRAACGSVAGFAGLRIPRADAAMCVHERSNRASRLAIGSSPGIVPLLRPSR
jgi:hypothetical protein